MLFQIRSFGAEGMIEEMLRYLNVAENVLYNMDPYQKSDLYGIVLHALVKAKEVWVWCRRGKLGFRRLCWRLIVPG
jgi:hypothetical protein